MFDLLDKYLLQRTFSGDDWTMEFRQFSGVSVTSSIVYFLPWNTSFWLARRVGLVGREFALCYEMPAALIGSDPRRSVKALNRLISDAERSLFRLKIDPAKLVVVGYSAGSYPATVLANRLRARLYSVTPADRADLMIWESPAVATVKARARGRGFRLQDYTDAMRGYQPIENLAGLAADTTFIAGTRDAFVPPARSRGLLDAVQKTLPSARIHQLPSGHVEALLKAGARLRREMAMSRPDWRPVQADQSSGSRVPAAAFTYRMPSVAGLIQSVRATLMPPFA